MNDPQHDLWLVGEVKYFPGKTTFSAKPGRLEWTNDGRIRLIALDKKTGEDVETVFDTTSDQVKAKRFPTSPSMYVLTVAGNKYKTDFAFKANLAAGLGGGLGRAAAKSVIAKSDLPAWIDAFEKAGILS